MVGTALMRLCPPYARRHCERSEAIQDRRKTLDCFVAHAPRNDGSPKRNFPIPRRDAPELIETNPQTEEGAGKAGCPNAPAASHANGRSIRVSPPQVRRFMPAFPARMVLRFPSRSPRRPGFVASVIGAMQSILANLTPALACQDHAGLRRPRPHRSSGDTFASIASRAQRP
jgi:hypothetical protein